MVDKSGVLRKMPLLYESGEIQDKIQEIKRESWNHGVFLEGLYESIEILYRELMTKFQELDENERWKK